MKTKPIDFLCKLCYINNRKFKKRKKFLNLFPKINKERSEDSMNLTHEEFLAVNEYLAEMFAEMTESYHKNLAIIAELGEKICDEHLSELQNSSDEE